MLTGATRSGKNVMLLASALNRDPSKFRYPVLPAPPSRISGHGPRITTVEASRGLSDARFSKHGPP